MTGKAERSFSISRPRLRKACSDHTLGVVPISETRHLDRAKREQMSRPCAAGDLSLSTASASRYPPHRRRSNGEVPCARPEGLTR